MQNAAHDVYDLIALNNNRENMYERAIQELQGLAYAVVFDNEVSDDELSILRSWCDRNRQFAEHWPIGDLINCLNDTESPNLKTLDLLKSISAGKNVVDLDFDTPPRFDLTERRVLLTGNFNAGTRKEIAALLKNYYVDQSGKEVTCKTDVLIVGEKGSEAWKFSGFGRKIESALQLRQSLGNPLIISETFFLNAILNTSYIVVCSRSRKITHAACGQTPMIAIQNARGFIAKLVKYRDISDEQILQGGVDASSAIKFLCVPQKMPEDLSLENLSNIYFRYSAPPSADAAPCS